MYGVVNLFLHLRRPLGLIFLLGLGVTSLFTYRRRRKIPFYDRLENEKKQDVGSYEISNIDVIGASVLADVIRGDKHYVLHISFRTARIIQVTLNDFRNQRHVVQDVVTCEDRAIIDTDFIMLRNEEEVCLRFKKIVVTIRIDALEINIYEQHILLMSINPRNCFRMEDESGNEGVMMDFHFAEATHLYGLPMHAERFFLRSTEDKPYRLYNTDKPRYGATQYHEPLHGAVPVVYGYHEHHTIGLLWLNASDTFVDVGHHPEGVFTTFRSEGGAVDFFVYTGPTMEACVMQNAQLTGQAALPPLFALGYHQGRSDYISQDAVKEVSDKFTQNELPLDAVWLDFNCADSDKCFTWNPDKFNNPEKMFKTLKKQKRKGVVMVPPHIKVDNRYDIYTTCEKGGFLLSANERQYEATSRAWVDFNNPAACEYISTMYAKYAIFANMHIWNDMNEPMVCNNGANNAFPKSLQHFEKLPHRVVHNMYGFCQTKATHDGLLKRNNVRPFVLTKSHFIGSQRYAAVWTGYSTASWENLRLSISMCLALSITGFSLCGADVGGSVDQPSEELLLRWYQAGAWLPFFRGYSTRDCPFKEPYFFPPEVRDRIRASLQQRYRHMLYWYTLFWQHKKNGEPVIRPMIYQYPKDSTMLELDKQFMVGKDILVSPVVEELQQRLNITIPGDKTTCWYYTNPTEVHMYPGGRRIVFPVGINTVPVFYRGGSVIPICEEAVRSADGCRNAPLSLYVFCDNSDCATGAVYIDDGETFDYQKGGYIHVKFKLDFHIFENIRLLKESKYPKSVVLSDIKLFGYKSRIAKAVLETDDLTDDGSRIHVNHCISYIHFTNINVDIQKDFLIRFTLVVDEYADIDM